VEVMDNVNTFLDENPTEVIVFIYQVNNDVDLTVDLNAFYSQLTQVDGFVDKMYVHGGTNVTWPTLRELKNTNKVCILFNNLRYRLCMFCFFSNFFQHEPNFPPPRLFEKFSVSLCFITTVQTALTNPMHAQAGCTCTMSTQATIFGNMIRFPASQTRQILVP
jgi:hypothetical protein